jgi:hypothetical protein
MKGAEVRGPHRLRRIEQRVRTSFESLDPHAVVSWSGSRSNWWRPSPTAPCQRQSAVAAALRLETAAASSADGLTSGAMVVSSRFEAARAWYFERQPGAHFVRSRRVYVDAQSYQAGKAAGAGVSIRQGISTTTDHRRLLT